MPSSSGHGAWKLAVVRARPQMLTDVDAHDHPFPPTYDEASRMPPRLCPAAVAIVQHQNRSELVLGKALGQFGHDPPLCVAPLASSLGCFTPFLLPSPPFFSCLLNALWEQGGLVFDDAFWGTTGGVLGSVMILEHVRRRSRDGGHIWFRAHGPRTRLGLEGSAVATVCCRAFFGCRAGLRGAADQGWRCRPHAGMVGRH